jgi:hypothetical protein
MKMNVNNKMSKKVRAVGFLLHLATGAALIFALVFIVRMMLFLSKVIFVGGH